MEIKSFKDREVDVTKPVDLYRCLNRKGFTFSVRQGGKVVGHTSDIVLKNCELIVNKSGKQRCITSQTRNVHAFVRGTIGTREDIENSFSFILNYNPYNDKNFFIRITDEEAEIEKCRTVYLQNNQIYCQI